VSLAKGIESTDTMAFDDAPSRARRIPKDGDVLVSTVRTYLKAIAPVVSPASNLVASTGFAVVRPRQDLQPGFLKYALQEEHFIQQVISRSTGISYPAINASDIARISLCMPGSSEQLAIANFLDRETAKIDALIAEQQRLIELLQEKRQVVISHAVTKGLNPDAPLKDSGVEWLGEVPEHWEVKPLRHVTNQVSVGVVVEPSKYYDDNGKVPALRSLNVRAGKIVMDECVHITAASNEILRKSKLRSGDLVVVRTGQPGTCAVIPDELDGCNCIDLIFIRKPPHGDSTYLMLSLCSDASRNQYAAGSEGAIQQHFNVKTASDLVIPWPPKEEQRAIAAWLQRKAADIDYLTTEVSTSIELLKERRSALISAAVTGQIDVRGLVPDADAA
jgi:type I restriction enzyme S subunit